MNNKLFKTLAVMAVFVFLFSAMAVAPAMAQPNLGIEYAENVGLQPANDSDPRNVAVDIVRYLMTFLGIIAVVIILLGGFKWMTAAGNEDRVSEAKQLIVAGIIGLIIILAAFAIVTFVINITGQAMNGDVGV